MRAARRRGEIVFQQSRLGFSSVWLERLQDLLGLEMICRNGMSRHVQVLHLQLVYNFI